jgi:hypothetical protein
LISNIGEVPVPGKGDSSLNPASIVTAALDIENGILGGSMQFVSPNATGFTERLLGLLPEGGPILLVLPETPLA